MKINRFTKLAELLLAAVCLPVVCLAQVNSGSDGHDGAFNPTTNTVINMADHPDGIYHYTAVNIPTNVTVTFIPNAINTPVVWLVQSICVINGIVDVSGKPGNDSGVGGAGGPGGFRGGNGSNTGSAGQGPGGGRSNGSTYGFAEGSFASYGSLGPTYSLGYDSATISPGAVYGNAFLLPLIGGSGGGGAIDRTCYYGGGGGGGALLIAVSNQIQLNGVINAQGGTAPGGDYAHVGGTGSGGGIRLVCSRLVGTGFIDVSGGSVVYTGYNYRLQAGSGRARLDVLLNNFAGQIAGVFTQGFQPILFTTTGQSAQLAVVSVGGASVAAPPTGMLDTPDAVLAAQQVNPITIVVRCSNLPLNTPITVSVKPMNGSPVSSVGYNTTGTLANSTATVLVNMPRGGGLIYATAATSN